MEMDNGMNEKLESEFANDSNPDELKNIIEAAILVSEEPVTVDRILGMFTDATKPERATVNEIFLDLEEEYANRGFELKQIDKGYRIQSREEYSPWLARLRAGRPPRYSRALLETLAIIAYRQPVTRGEIEEIRGVAVSTDIIRTLVDREWVRQVGVRDVPGKPALFATTRSFLEYFNLQGLSQLPSLQEIRDMDTIAAELNMKLPLEDFKNKGEVSNTDEATDTENETATEKNDVQDPQADLLENINSSDDEDFVDKETVTVDESDPAEDSLATNTDENKGNETSDEDDPQLS
jgi:segregation and condensation protein B